MTLLQMSGMGTVLICFIVLLRKLVEDRLSPGCYLILWLLAGIRLLVPFSLTSPFSVYQLLQQSPTKDGLISYPQTIEPAIEWMLDTTTVPVTMIHTMRWNMVLWLVGALLSFLTIIALHWRRRMVYHTSLPMKSDWVQAWQNAHTLHRNYQIRQCQQITTPLTYGVICPVILLPAYQEELDEEVDMMLLHEWNHIRHCDTLWQWLLVILCSVHWFNPAVWFMASCCRKELELFCDRATVHQLQPDQCKTYALLLLRQSNLIAPQSPFFSHFCSTGYHRMEERVCAIMKQKPLTWKAVLVTVGLCCMGCLCFVASAADENIEIKKLVPVEHGIVQENQEMLNLYWPVAANNGQITANYGERLHPITGETIKLEYISIGGVEVGTDLVASASGIVKETGFDTQRGNYVILQCENGLELHYSHCKSVIVATGDTVTALQTIATLGQTGIATGPCLSFAVYQNGEAKNPMEYLKPII